jgi:epoxide hydrolase-like predicted phosphatase
MNWEAKIFYNYKENLTMIRAFIFDMGGVIVDIRPFLAQTIKVFQPECEEEFWENINVEAASLCRGEITLLEFWKSVAQKFKKDISDDILKDLWVMKGEPSLNEGIEDIIYSLKNRYKLAILSNTMREHKFEKKGIFSLFDVVVLSCDVGLTKDNPDVFLLVAEELKVLPEECVFIDDIQEFVDVSRSVGMQGILFENSEKLKYDLKECGIKIE